MTWVLAGCLMASVLPPVASAQVKQGASASSPPAMHQPAVRIAPAARDAVAVVGTFFDALSRGNFAVAREQLDPGVVVVTNGVLRGGREVYMAEQSRADADFLKRSQRGLLRRDAQGNGQLAWVLSEKVFRTGQGAPETRTIETLVLTNTPSGWKIVHIHWSTRPLVGR